MSATQPTPRNNRRSREIFAEAEKVLVGGVNSPVRAFRSVGGEPLIIERGLGQFLYDADGNQLLDFVCSWGAMLLGHANPAVAAAVADQAQKGTSYGVTTELEVRLAQRIRQAIPFLEKVRFVSSGTEATMSALRLARGFTGRDLLIKFEGCYHGHADSFLSQAGSGLATLGIAECPGVPQALAGLTLNAPYNDLAAVEKLFGAHKDKIAAVIVEPIAANMGVVVPAQGFLQGLRELTRKHGALLIVDEVITGFRLRNGSVQNLFGIEADLTTLGKIIGGGLPVAAYGGKAEIMDRVAPLGPVYQAGTLAGNPLAMRAGIATLAQLSAPGLYERIDRKAGRNFGRCHSRMPENRKNSRLRQCHRFAGHAFLYARTRYQLRRRKEIRHQALYPILPKHAGARRFPCAVPVRSILRLGRSLGRRHRLCDTSSAGKSSQNRHFLGREKSYAGNRNPRSSR